MQTLTLGIELDVRAVLAVANTRHGPEALRPVAPGPGVRVVGGFDRLRSPRETAAFLRGLGVELPTGEPGRDLLLRLRNVREAARSLAEGYEAGYHRRCAAALRDARFLVKGRELRAGAQRWDAFADALALPLLALWDVRDRLKICRNSACGWTFLDTTRGGGQVWCDLQGCANRLRVRNFRSRQRRRSR